MSLATRRPTAVCGANVNSGFVNSREQAIKTGGEFKCALFSGGLAGSLVGFNLYAIGVADQVRLVSGPGRLKAVICHAAISGTQTVLYESAVAALSGGTGPGLSGYPIVATVPGNSWAGGAAGLNGASHIQMDVPFHSGLCASNISGTVGFTIIYTPETNPVDRDTAG